MGALDSVVCVGVRELGGGGSGQLGNKREKAMLN